MAGQADATTAAHAHTNTGAGREMHPLTHSAGEVTAEELEQMMTIVANPRQYKIPDWFLNRQKDIKDGRFSQLTSSQMETKLRDDLERLKKIRCAGGGGDQRGLECVCTGVCERPSCTPHAGRSCL